MLSNLLKIYIITQTLIQKRCVMKSYDELKAEMETIQQQMAEGRKNNDNCVLDDEINLKLS